MTGILKQYRTEIRNILVLTLVVMLLPYLPKLGAYLLTTTTGAIIALSLAGSLVLAFTLKIYFRILVMRINNDNKTVA
ncbi:hypothetical protein [Chitinophaga sp. CF418]|uniref:hypothetical protein n=1 Tax=Chitinophaga sp. CF418 TaxID=1855287 RepID=UPI00092224C2|nr:hypothetical protein [Chitinophaga sp. CF418]SHN41973.1 hypothetical protein SAMN05216311_11444 [Chitinophaga sp. CF418]